MHNLITSIQYSIQFSDQNSINSHNSDHRLISQIKNQPT
jgi:hypothetical protein